MDKKAAKLKQEKDEQVEVMPKQVFEYKLNGYKVTFPFKPYGPQLAYMSQVVKTLENKQNALLEAPTGTGKTMAMLCSALAWQASKKEQAVTLQS